MFICSPSGFGPDVKFEGIQECSNLGHGWMGRTGWKIVIQDDTGSFVLAECRSFLATTGRNA